MFTVHVSDDPKQTIASLKAFGKTEQEHGRPKPDPALAAYQGVLQMKTPWYVTVPFLNALIDELAREPAIPPRRKRDLARLVALIKSIAVVRHHHRTTDSQGYLEATLGDYRTAYGLLKEHWESTTSGASKAIRQLVHAVRKLRKASPSLQIKLGDVAKFLKRDPSTISPKVTQALEGKWLVNEGKAERFNLKVGEPLPKRSGLPTPERLAQVFKAA
jgi:hypothetical protein